MNNNIRSFFIVLGLIIAIFGFVGVLVNMFYGGSDTLIAFVVLFVGFIIIKIASHGIKKQDDAK